MMKFACRSKFTVTMLHVIWAFRLTRSLRKDGFFIQCYRTRYHILLGIHCWRLSIITFWMYCRICLILYNKSQYWLEGTKLYSVWQSKHNDLILARKSGWKLRMRVLTHFFQETCTLNCFNFFSFPVEISGYIQNGHLSFSHKLFTTVSLKS
jgi:hypothetical protein